MTQTPTQEELTALLGPDLYEAWTGFCALLEARFLTESRWNSGGMRWKYECQYRQGGRRLCTLFARRKCAALQIVFSRVEQERFTEEKKTYSRRIQRAYDLAERYPDGKRFLFGLSDSSLFPEFVRLLYIGHSPDKKAGADSCS